MFSFPQVSLPKRCIQLSSHPYLLLFTAYLILLDLISRTILGEQYRLLSSSLCSFLHSPVTSSYLGPNTPLNTLFSHTLNLYSSLIISDQVSHPYETTGKPFLLTLPFTIKISQWRLSSIQQIAVYVRLVLYMNGVRTLLVL